MCAGLGSAHGASHSRERDVERVEEKCNSMEEREREWIVG